MLYIPGFASVPLSEILYLSGNDSYTWFHLTSGKRLLSSLHLGYYQSQAEGFIRIHKRFLVNPVYVVSFSRTGPESAVVSLTGNQQLPVAKRRITTVLARLRERRILASVPVVS